MSEIKITVDPKSGFCFGVVYAIEMAENILKKENDKYFLVTPVEKVGITVADAPFIATEIDLVTKDRKVLMKFITNIGDATYLERYSQFKILFKNSTNEPQPYIHVRSNLFAKIDRKSFYRLVDYCTEAPYKGENWFGFRSNNIFFPLVKSEKID